MSAVQCPSVPIQGPSFPGDAGSQDCGRLCAAGEGWDFSGRGGTEEVGLRRGAGPKCLLSADAQQVLEPGGGPASEPGWPASPQGLLPMGPSRAGPPGGPFKWLVRAWGAVSACACLSICMSLLSLPPSQRLPRCPEVDPTAIKGSLELDHLGCLNPSSTIYSCLIMDTLVLRCASFSICKMGSWGCYEGQS